MRADLGLHIGRGVVAETLAGFVTYCMAIPMLLLGLLLTFALMALQKMVTPDAAPPSHPVQQMVMGADRTTLIVAMLLAAVVAPFVEEIIFRGALFRHLRDGTWRLGTIGSFAVAAIVSSVLFAAIHPQGWPFIPVLGSLAAAFCVAREWRGSVWPGMVAHGLNNFVIMTLNILLLQ
jgi:membrane protease YdiL (CAAX protease family)